MSNLPPGFSPYPRSNFSGGNRRPPGIYFDVLSPAWEIVKNNLNVFIPSMLLYLVSTMIILVAAQLGASMIVFGTIFAPDTPGIGKALEIQALILIPNTISWVMFQGIFYQSLKLVRGEPTSIGDMFHGFKFYLHLVGAQILITIGTLIGAFMCLLPGLIFASITYCFGLIVIDRGENAVEAIGTSLKAFRSFAFPMLAFIIAFGFLASLGILACGVGMLFTVPIMTVAVAMTYDNFFPQGAPSQPWIGEQPPH